MYFVEMKVNNENDIKVLNFCILCMMIDTIVSNFMIEYKRLS